ncbi:MAG: glucose-6-phosphate isomerase [Nitrospirae bacterium]|jgi:glucose-6-phosphate isomerase|nr:glucose-6-phosphate isomerase [Nitrospirota bacterium]
MIGIDYSNMMEEVIGINGISDLSIKNISSQIENAYNMIANREWKQLEFIDLPSQDTAEIKKIARYIRKSADNFLLLGIGGSALGPRAIIEALSPFHNLKKKPRVFIYDNVDPRTLKSIFTVIDLKKTFINVISKSGSTAETAASFLILWDKMKRALGKEAFRRFIITTDPEKGNLRKIANDEKILSLPVPPNVGGRYSVLSPVGLLTTEVIGINCNELLEGASSIKSICLKNDVYKNPALLFAVLLFLMDKEKNRHINVMVPYMDSLKFLSEWFCQLWAESLGKGNKGLTPYPSLGTTDQHSQLQLWMEGPQDKVVFFIKVNNFGTDIKIPAVFRNIEGYNYLPGHTLKELINSEQEATELALTKAGRPNFTINVPEINAYYLGQLFFFFEMATAFAGALLGVNPFDQPGVEEGKNLTYGMMGKKGFEDKKKEVYEYRKRKGKWKI